MSKPSPTERTTINRVRKTLHNLNGICAGAIDAAYEHAIYHIWRKHMEAQSENPDFYDYYGFDGEEFLYKWDIDRLY